MHGRPRNAPIRPGPWNYCRNLYMARVALDGRKQPDASKSGAKRNYLKAGEWVAIRCQAYDYDGHTGERLGLLTRWAITSSPTST